MFLSFAFYLRTNNNGQHGSSDHFPMIRKLIASTEKKKKELVAF